MDDFETKPETIESQQPIKEIKSNSVDHNNLDETRIEPEEDDIEPPQNDFQVDVKKQTTPKTHTQESTKIFKICPYCGEELNLPKKPNFCPYCKEPFF